MVSPAVFDAASGTCLNTIENLWETKAPRGSELFLADGQVRVVDSMMYAPREYIPSRYHAKYLLQVASGNRVIQGTQNAMMCLELGAAEDAKPKLVWKEERMVDTSAVVMSGNGILVAGLLPAANQDEEPRPALQFIDAASGKLLWSEILPAPTVNWGVAVDRDGRVIATLRNGQTVCYSGSRNVAGLK